MIFTKVQNSFFYHNILLLYWVWTPHCGAGLDLSLEPHGVIRHVNCTIKTIAKCMIMCCFKTHDQSLFCLDPDYEEEKLKILAGERLPLPEFADLMPWGTEVYEKVQLHMN